MAVIHLEFDVDSDVHPELHAMLSAVANAQSRAERLRQLAATGFIWEKLRLQSQLGAEPKEPLAPLSGAAPAAEPAALAAAPDSEGSEPADDDFVDLSMVDTPPPAPPWAASPTLREIEREFENAVYELPVLYDVVYPPGEMPPTASSATDAAEPPEPPATARRPDTVVVDIRDGTTDLLARAAGDDAQPAAPKPAARPRLVRMKEKGLFKNGPD